MWKKREVMVNVSIAVALSCSNSDWSIGSNLFKRGMKTWYDEFSRFKLVLSDQGK